MGEQLNVALNNFFLADRVVAIEWPALCYNKAALMVGEMRPA